MSEALGPGVHREADLEALLSRREIEDLAHCYALALDVRDIDAAADLFVEDIAVPMLPGRPIGRAALSGYLEQGMEFFRGRGVYHANTNHLVEFHDSDHAYGTLLCRSDDDAADTFVHGSLQYWDEYVRERRTWLFARREVLYWYLADARSAPVGEHKIRFPGREARSGQLPQFWGSFRDHAHGKARGADEFGGSFLRRLRRLPALEHRPEGVAREFVDWLGMPEGPFDSRSAASLSAGSA